MQKNTRYQSIEVKGKELKYEVKEKTKQNTIVEVEFKVKGKTKRDTVVLEQIWQERNVIEFLRPYMRGKILDAGCGPGGNTHNFQNVVGVDDREVALYLASLNGLKTYRMDLNETLRFKDKVFDTVFSSHVLEHLTSPYKTLLEFNRILKDDGYLVIGVPNANSIMFDPAKVKIPHITSHICAFTDKTMRFMLRKTGFEPIKQFTNFPFNRIVGKVLNLPVIKNHWTELFYVCKKGEPPFPFHKD